MGIFEGLFVGQPKWTVDKVPNMSGKVAIVTGGAVGIGHETVKVLVERGAKVVIATRSEEKSKQAIEQLRALHIPKVDELVDFIHIDLANLCSIKPFADAFLSKYNRLHYLINNAGVMFPPKNSMTTDGYDLQFGTNVLGHFALTQALLPLLVDTAKSSLTPVRVVWLTSSGHHAAPKDTPIHWDELTNTKQTLSNIALYGQSKAGNILLAFYMQKRFAANNIQTIAVHPGGIRSELKRHTGFFEGLLLECIQYPQPHGAINTMFAVSSPEIKGGEYIIPWTNIITPRNDMLDEELQKESWIKSCEIMKKHGVAINYE